MASTPQPPAPVRRKKRASGVVVPHAPRWHQRLGAWLVYALVRVVFVTLRRRWPRGVGPIADPQAGPVIVCLWHNRLALCATAYHAAVKLGGGRKTPPVPGIAALVSASRDGGFLSAILDRFEIEVARGSSSRRGPQALLELTSWAERGYDLAITPDGPRGPCYVLQEGIMSLAQVTGLPIMPFSYHLNWKLQLKSWDRFQIPLPFARCDLVIGPTVRVPREATDEQREALRQQLEKTMRELAPD
jgi:lysophospholipid acyltransferase (LPLAT)-like uncharacterized protein